MKAVSRRRSRCTTNPSLETLESRLLLSAFVSAAGSGNWSSLSAWATQDGGAVTRIPTSGDTVTINGKITVDVATTIGTGSGDAITLGSSTNMGDKALSVAAPLIVQGNIKSQGKSVVDVLAGAGMDFDAAAGVQPTIHCAYGSQINLYFHGTDANHSYLRTKAGTAGGTLYIRPDSGSSFATNVGATYTDFADINGPTGVFGMYLWPATGALSSTIDHCSFTRTSIYVQVSTSLDTNSTVFTISNSSFTQTPTVAYGDGYTVWLQGSNLIDLTADSLDPKMYMRSVRNVTSCVFRGSVYQDPYNVPNFITWSDNLYNITDTANGYLNTRPGTYNRTYFLCNVPDASNPHISMQNTNTAYNQVIFDVPLAHDVDDACMILQSGVVNDSVSRCLSLPHVGGSFIGSGVSLSFACGINIAIDHNTVAIGNQPGVKSDPSHGGTTGGITEFKNNIGYTPDGVTAGGSLVYAYPSTYIDAVAPGQCDYNAKYNTVYSMTTTVAPGAHDVNGQNPNFIDPTRDLVKFYRMFSGITPGPIAADVPASFEWIFQHPQMVPQLIDWVYNGYIPTNIAYKAASDNVAPTNGWIGAMEGKPVGDANLDGKTNFQDYIVLERNFGQANMGWEGGDFNNDGVVNFQDYIILERNFGTSYVSAAPAQDVASPLELAARIAPTGGTDLPASTPVVGPVAPLYMVNGTTTTSTPSVLFSASGPLALPTMSSTSPALRTVTWAKAQKWQVPPVKGAADACMIDVLGAAVL